MTTKLQTLIIRFADFGHAVSTRFTSWHQLAPSHGINTPQWQAPRVMPVSTRPMSWYQLTPSHGINSPHWQAPRITPVSTRPRSWYQLAPSQINSMNGSNTMDFYA